MTVRRKEPVSEESVALVADATNLPAEYVRGLMKPTYTTVERVVIDRNGEPQVKVTSCCCSSPGALRRICARTRNLKTPCRCFCHSHETQADATARMKARSVR